MKPFLPEPEFEDLGGRALFAFHVPSAAVGHLGGVMGWAARYDRQGGLGGTLVVVELGSGGSHRKVGRTSCYRDHALYEATWLEMVDMYDHPAEPEAGDTVIHGRDGKFMVGDNEHLSMTSACAEIMDDPDYATQVWFLSERMKFHWISWELLPDLARL